MSRAPHPLITSLLVLGGAGAGGFVTAWVAILPLAEKSAKGDFGAGMAIGIVAPILFTIGASLGALTAFVMAYIRTPQAQFRVTSACTIVAGTVFLLSCIMTLDRLSLPKDSSFIIIALPWSFLLLVYGCRGQFRV